MTFPAQLLSFISFAQSQQAFATVGSYNFTVPDGVTMMSAVATGGGGGGAGSNASGDGTGGGGGGGTSWGVFSVEPGDILQIVVGSGGTGGTSATGNGQNGGSSVIRLATRGGISKNQTIIQGNGGSGGTRVAGGTGIGGAGGSYSANTSPDGSFTVFVGAGGTGGSGGSSDVGGGGGGGAGGYNGNGGNGGRLSPTVIAPTAAVLNSGGGGGGGGISATSSSNVGYGGGGTGSYGYSGVGQGDAGTNSPNNATLGSGGKGASFFLDPGFAINAEFIAQSTSTTTSIDYPTGLQSNDFLLLLSGSDRFTGSGAPATNFTTIPAPAEFTELFRSTNGEYPVSSAGAATSIIPFNIPGATTPSRDLNFTASYRYVPAGGLTGSLSGLTTSSIHNLIALRYIPGDDANPSTITWANDSADPSSNTGAGNYTLMPNPPGVVGVSSNSIGIALGFLSNTVLNPGADAAGDNTTLIRSISGGAPGVSGEGIGLVASYMQTTSLGNYNPEPFLTGTTSHARAYSIQVNRTGVGTATIVGSAATSTWFIGATEQNPTSLPLPVTPNDNDLIVYIAAWDSPGIPATPSLGAGFFTVPVGAGVTIGGGNSDGDDFAGNTSDRRSTGGIGFKICYGIWNTGDPTTVTGMQSSGGGDTPITHMVIVIRGGSLSYNGGTNPPRYAVSDNGDDTVYGPPDPPQLTTATIGGAPQPGTNSMILAIGMIDNISISNVTTITPPTNYTMLANQSYGVQNNGLIIMSAYRQILTDLIQENPTAFVGGGGNIWASSTLIISGNNISVQTNGTNLAAGLYGGGGGSYSDDASGPGMSGAQGGVRLIWGGARQYPSTNQGNAPDRL